MNHFRVDVIADVQLLPITLNGCYSAKSASSRDEPFPGEYIPGHSLIDGIKSTPIITVFDFLHQLVKMQTLVDL